MTKQEMRLFSHRKRKEKAKEEEENALMERVHKRQKDILEDPKRVKWNQYDCWNYRTIEGIFDDAGDGWEFIVDGGHVIATNNPVLEAEKEKEEKSGDAERKPCQTDAS